MFQLCSINQHDVKETVKREGGYTMKRSVVTSMFITICFFLMLPDHALARMYNIEVLQVTKIGPFEELYRGFTEELAKNGFVDGANLKINRTVIDFDVEKGGLWKKIGVLFSIKKEASRIVNAKPDLVLTIGTPSTKYAKDKIISAGIPLVFSGVAFPVEAGCKSLTEAGPGFTGASLYMDMNTSLKIIHLAFPDITKIGIVYTNDDNAKVHERQARELGPSFGISFLTKEVKKSDSLIPAAEELIGQGAQGFLMPLDAYYGLRDFKPSRELGQISIKHNVPMVTLVFYRFPGACLYLGSDFALIGSFSAQHSVKILKGEARPDDLPILRSKDLSIMVDTDVLKNLGIELPLEILQLAKSIK